MQLAAKGISVKFENDEIIYGLVVLLFYLRTFDRHVFMYAGNCTFAENLR